MSRVFATRTDGIVEIPKIIPLTNAMNSGIKLTKAKRKAYYEQQTRARNDAIIQKRIDDILYFSDERRAIGDLTKDIHFYSVGINTFNIYYDDDPHGPIRETPANFSLRDSVVFDNTWVIAIDIDETDMRVDIGGVMCIPNYELADPETRAEFDRQIEAGARSNPKLMTFNKHNPTIVYSVRINIWFRPTSIDYWLRIIYRPNRIYLSDYDGFKVFDFELKLLYFKPILDTDDGVYGFKVDPENWNNVWVWNAENAREVTGYYGVNGQEYNGICRDIYEDTDGILEICEYIRT